jgi:hypothetical protein
MAALAADLARGLQVGEIAAQLGGPFASEADMLGAAFDTAMLALLSGQTELGVALLRDVLFQARQFRVIPSLAYNARRLRVLGLMAAGDLQTNLPIEFITAHLPVQLDLLFVAEGQDLPVNLPAHDLTICLISDARPDILRQLVSQLADWPTPILNNPANMLGGHVESLCREGIARLFVGSRTVLAPQTWTFDRAGLLANADLPVAEWPILARPEHSHAGQHLELLHGADQLVAYGHRHCDHRLTLTQFIDYRNADGMFRKRRIALIAGEPFLCHMAISGHWMIHYANAGMVDSADKRAEEAAAMVEFDTGFARRHRAAFAEICSALGLDYVLLDCAEAADGRLLLFEVEMAAIVHALDPAELFAYKQPQMQRVFEAFYRMLAQSAGAMALVS